jgi:Cu-processing system permease protein
MAFLSVGLLASTIARKRSTAVGMSVLLWFFFAVIFDVVLLGIFVATGGTIDFQTGRIDLPGWYYAVALANPTEAFGMFALLTFGITSAFGFPATLPGFVTLAVTALSMILWTTIPLFFSMWRFQGQDL